MLPSPIAPGEQHSPTNLLGWTISGLLNQKSEDIKQLIILSLVWRLNKSQHNIQIQSVRRINRWWHPPTCAHTHTHREQKSAFQPHSTRFPGSCPRRCGQIHPGNSGTLIISWLLWGEMALQSSWEPRKRINININAKVSCHATPKERNPKWCKWAVVNWGF